MAWALHMQTHRFKCQNPKCGKMFGAPKKTKRQQTCSRSCMAAMRDPESHRALCRKGGAATASRARVKFVAAMRVLGATDAAIECALAYGRGRATSSHEKGRTCGYRKGWSEAMWATRPGRRT